METTTAVVIIFVLIFLIVIVLAVLNVMGYVKSGPYVGQPSYSSHYHRSQPMIVSQPNVPPAVRLAQAFTGSGQS